MYSVIRRKRNYTISSATAPLTVQAEREPAALRASMASAVFREMETAATESILFTGNGAHMDDIFGDLFGDMFHGAGGSGFQGERFYSGGPGGSFRGRGRDLNTEVTVTFDEAAFGCDKLLNFRREGRQCPDSAGSYSGRH